MKELEDKEQINPEDNDIIENQILGKRSRKDLGLTKERESETREKSRF